MILDGAKEEPLSSLETNVTAMRILDAARRSAETEQTITLLEVTGGR